MRLPFQAKAEKFKSSFRFGVGNSDHQCESFDPASADIWDSWETARNLPPRGRATEFQNRYEEDIALAASLGAAVFRFSVSWAKVEPRPGEFDAEALAHYRRLVDAIQAAGMAPFVTLHHFVWPLHVEERGGMRAPGFPTWFADYAERVAAALGPAATDWITFNEPNLLCFGYFRPWWQHEFSFPPGLPLDYGLTEQLRAVALLIRNLFLAHTEARLRIRGRYPSARVGANPSVLGLPDWVQALIDRRLTKAGTLDQFMRSQRMGRRRRFRSNRTAAVLSSFSITEQRSESIDFTSPYLTAGLALMTRASTLFTDPAEFKGQLGVVAGSTAEQQAGRLVPGARIRSFAEWPLLKSALEDDDVEAVLADDLLLLPWVAASNGRFRLLKRRLTTESYGIGTSRGSGMMDAMEAALAAFRASGELDRAIQRHLPGYSEKPPEAGTARRTVAGIADPQASQRAQDPAYWRTYAAQILGGKPLRIGVSSTVPGLGMRDKSSGEWSGLEIDLARYIAQFLMGDASRLELVPVTVRARMTLLGGFLLWLQRLLEPIAILSAVICTNWWHLGMSGRLPEFLCPRHCVGQQDFIGFDYYWGLSGFGVMRIKGLIKALSTGDFSDAPIWVGGLGRILRYHHKLIGNLPIYLVENGSIENVGKVAREAYIRDHVAEAQRAVSRGIPLTMFVVWSITSNREWNSRQPAGCDFGLYRVDLDGDPALQRIETPSAAALRRIIVERGTS